MPRITRPAPHLLPTLVLISGGLLAGEAAFVAQAFRPAESEKRPTAAPAGKLGIPSDDRAIAHLLNRIAFGPRPGDIERVRTMGVARYIEQQLYPERISDAAMDARLAEFETLQMTTADIAEKYYLPAQMERRERKRTQRQSPPDAASGPERMREPEGAQSGGSQPAVAADARRRGGQRLDAMRNPRAVLAELTEQKLLRAISSERQLNEVMVDFWFNHFNVFAGKGLDRIFLTSYERDTIRPHALGKFRDLLGAVAESPAMLFYLDNWMSVDPNAANALANRQQRPDIGMMRPRGRFRVPGMGRQNPGAAGQQKPPQQRRLGLNENYARELMELHTLGVDGGYTQKDVMEVARAFTGWTLDRPRGGAGGFRFESRVHDRGEKVVLGHAIKEGGGKGDGDLVLDILARHPSTARFVATKLARRFVADDPPRSLIDRAAARFTETDGDIREVLRTIVVSTEFFAPDAYRAKVKTPLEFVASAVRITGARVDSALALAQALRQLGMPLYFAQPPTGYSDRADAWVNTGALLNRMNFAVALVNNRLPGVTVDLEALAGSADAAAARQRLAEKILFTDASSSTRATIEKGTALTQVAALAIGAPEFQRR